MFGTIGTAAGAGAGSGAAAVFADSREERLGEAIESGARGPRVIKAMIRHAIKVFEIQW
jgi:hypothetical protein